MEEVAKMSRSQQPVEAPKDVKSSVYSVSSSAETTARDNHAMSSLVTVNASAWNGSMTDVDDQTRWTTCASYTKCEDCLAMAYYGCHFCEEDYKCHAIPMGCTVGMSTCHNIKECVRPKPEQVGYGPPFSVVIAVLVLVTTIGCCVCGVSSVCSVYLRKGNRRRKRNQAHHLRPKASTGSKEQALLGDEDDPEETDSLMAYEQDVDDRSLDRVATARTESEEVSWKTCLYRQLWLAILLFLTVIALMFYPRIPYYNVCNREFEWSSIFASLRSAEPKIEYQVLLSVINENRFGFIIEEGYADIYHNGTKVGRWVVNGTWEAAAGSITDMLAPVKIAPGFTEGYKLWKDFYNNRLDFNISASITGSITWGKYKIYRISSTPDPIIFRVGAKYDRSLCNCSDYEQ